jgi:hypothetical protein
MATESPKVLTEDALLLCKHVLGRVKIEHAQGWVTVAGRAVLVDNDPEGRSIESCPWTGIGVKKCQKTLRVIRGYSTLVFVDGKAVCLDTVTGFTESLPPVLYNVQHPGQVLVGVAS